MEKIVNIHCHIAIHRGGVKSGHYHMESSRRSGCRPLASSNPAVQSLLKNIISDTIYGAGNVILHSKLTSTLS